MTAVRPEKILRELAELWVSLGKEQSSGVLRACAMTLIVAVDNARDAVSAGETLAELVHEHPSRAIVLKLEEPSHEMLDARVFAQCWIPFGGRQQICCEQIEITASCDRLAGVTPIVLGITAPDLPVVLWSRSARILQLPEFRQILPLADKVIVDSELLGAPREALGIVRTLGAPGRQIADLAWTRLTRWRELVADAFGEPGRLTRLSEITAIVISHVGPAPPAGAYYLGAWLQASLGTQKKPSLEFRVAAEDGTPRPDPIRTVELSAAEWKASFEVVDGTAVVEVDGIQSRSGVAHLSEYALLREELSILEHDAIFERALKDAVKLIETGR